MRGWVAFAFGVFLLVSGLFCVRFFYEKRLAKVHDELLQAEQKNAENEELERSLRELDERFSSIPPVKRTGFIGDEAYIRAFLGEVTAREGLLNGDAQIAKRAEGFGEAKQNFATFVVDFTFEVTGEDGLRAVFRQFDEKLEGYVIVNALNLKATGEGRPAKVRLKFLVIFIGL